MKGGAGFLCLWMVKGSNSRDFLLRRNSKSMSYKFVGDETWESSGVIATIGSLSFVDGEEFFMGIAEDEEIRMGWEPTVKSLKLMGGRGGIDLPSFSSGIGAQGRFRDLFSVEKRNLAELSSLESRP